MGFVGVHGAYLSDAWNWLDLFVILAGIVDASLPNVPSVSAIRTIRIMRALRSLHLFPEIQAIVTSIVSALPQLGAVMLFLFFFVVFVSIVGLQSFSGPYLHTQCRLTPYPVNTSWVVGLPYEPYRCLDAINFDVPMDAPNWDKEESLWFQPQDCFWPLAPPSGPYRQNCALNDRLGKHRCVHDTPLVPESQWTWCGSDYDAYGNPRFLNIAADPSNDASVYFNDLNYGYTNFDNFGRSFLTVYQVLTQEGWTQIMYFVMDSYGASAGACYFIFIVTVGSFFLIGCIVAVLEDSFYRAHFSEEGDDQDKVIDTQESKDDNPTLFWRLINTCTSKATTFASTLMSSIIDSTPQYITDAGAWIKRLCVRIYISSLFDGFSILMIGLNLTILIMDHYPMEPLMQYALDGINAIISIFFCIEAIIKITALGSKFFTNFFAVYDVCVVIVSIVDVIIFPPEMFLPGGDSGSAASLKAVGVLRVFRLVRLARILNRFKSVRILIVRIIKTFYDLFPFMSILLLFMIIYTLFGMQFFANRFRFDLNGKPITEIHSPQWLNAPDIPRYNFDNWNNAFASVFQVMSTENWNVIMINCWRALGPFSVIYTCSIIVIGTYLLMNLFLAILISNFEKYEIDDMDDKYGIKQNPDGLLLNQEENHDEECNDNDNDNDDHAPASSASVTSDPLPSDALKSDVTTDTANGANGDSSVVNEAKNDDVIKENNNSSDAKSSWFTLTSQNPIRKCFLQLIKHPLFDPTVMVVIIISSVLLAIDSPLLDPQSQLYSFLRVAEVVITFIFVGEMVFKFIALGVVSYMTDGWNVLDFIIIVISVITLYVSTGSTGNLNALRALRAFRALRPLRMIRFAPGLRIVVDSTLASAPEMAKVFVSVLIIYSVFAIVAVNFLKGDLRTCEGNIFNTVISANSSYVQMMRQPLHWNEMVPFQQEWLGLNSPLMPNEGQSGYEYWDVNCNNWPAQPCCNLVDTNSRPTSKDLCLCWGGNWGPAQNQLFDNFPGALMSFFQISTTEGWIDLMYASVDSNGVDMMPIYNNNPIYIYFYILFIIMGNFFAINLFVGALMEKFHSSKKGVEGQRFSFMTEEQVQWRKTQVISHKLNPKKDYPKPPDFIGQCCYFITKNPYFDTANLVVILCNTIALALQYYGMSTTYAMTLNYLNVAFSLYFTAEAIVKIVAMRWIYFLSKWNSFDLAIVIATDIGLLVFSINNDNNGLVVTLARTTRIIRVFRLCGRRARELLNTIMLTIPGMFNISLLLMLLLFIYTVMAVQLFAKTEYNASYYTDANFMTFGMALLTLFRFMTGEAWDTFMYDMSPSLPSCVVDPHYDPAYCGFWNREGCLPLNGCGNAGAIFPFLLTFTLVVTMIVFQLFLGVIIEGFSEANSSDKIVKSDDFRTFADHWRKFDPQGTCYIHILSLGEFVMTLESPLGYKDCWDVSDEFIHRRIAQLNIYIYNGHQVHFHDLLGALTSEAYMRKEGAIEYNALYDAFKQEKITKKRIIGTSKLSTKDVSKSMEGSTFKAIDYHAARLLQKAWGRYQKNRNKYAVRNSALKVIGRKMIKNVSSTSLTSPPPPALHPPPPPADNIDVNMERVEPPIDSAEMQIELTTLHDSDTQAADDHTSDYVPANVSSPSSSSESLPVDSTAPTSSSSSSPLIDSTLSLDPLDNTNTITHTQAQVQVHANANAEDADSLLLSDWHDCILEDINPLPTPLPLPPLTSPPTHTPSPLNR